MMDLISLAVPFFLLAIAAEIVLDRRSGNGYIPLADAISSLSAGAMSTLTGVVTKLVGIGVYALLLEHVAPVRMPMTWFDGSAAGILRWALALLAYDFLYYWKHRLGHEVAIFWAAHSVHHQSEEYNLTTALRQTSTDFLVGWIVYIPLFLTGLPLEVFAVVSAIDLIYQFWVHTRYVDKLGWVDRVFVTPSNHRVHHAQNDRYIDKNYGGILILWDRIFGTFQPEDDRDPPIFGVRKPLKSFGPVNANLHVYRSLWADAAATRRWRDKLRIWFARTGWRPSDREHEAPLELRPLSNFSKYQTDLTDARRNFIVSEFAFTLLATLTVQLLPMPQALTLLLVLLICLQLIAIGLASDVHAAFGRFQYSRLFLSILAAISAVFSGFASVWLVAIVVAYSVSSGYFAAQVLVPQRSA